MSFRDEERIGVGRFVAFASAQGWPVWLEVGRCPYDAVAEIDGVLRRVEIRRAGAAQRAGRAHTESTRYKIKTAGDFDYLFASTPAGDFWLNRNQIRGRKSIDFTKQSPNMVRHHFSEGGGCVDVPAGLGAGWPGF